MSKQQFVNQQSGFTLIELIAVIVILGILAATAIPRFVNLQDAAQEAALAGVAGALESGSALNHAVDIALEAGLSTTETVVAIDSCDDAAGLLSTSLPVGYSLSASAVADHVATDCELSGPNSSSATVIIIGAQ